MTRIKTADDLPPDFGNINGHPHPDSVIADTARAAERERCAKIAEEFMALDKDAPVFRGRTIGYAIACAIRKSE